MEADLHELYGIDLGDPATLRRPWAWLKSRVEGLLSRPPVMIGHDKDGAPVWMQTTRIGLQLDNN